MSYPEFVIERAKPDDFVNPRKMFIGWVPTCGTVVGHDIQSGPILCDKVAQYNAANRNRLDMVCYFCEEHFPDRLREEVNK